MPISSISYIQAQFRTRIINEIRRIRVNDLDDDEELVDFKNSISCKAINRYLIIYNIQLIV